GPRDWSSDVCSSDLMFIGAARCMAKASAPISGLLSAGALVGGAETRNRRGRLSHASRGPYEHRPKPPVHFRARAFPVVGDAHGRSEEHRVGKGGGCW